MLIPTKVEKCPTCHGKGMVPVEWIYQKEMALKHYIEALGRLCDREITREY